MSYSVMDLASELLAASKMTPATISKTRHMSGVQCEKKLYLEVKAPHLAGEVDVMQETIRRMGEEIGQLARSRYTNGAVVEVDPSNPGPAVVKTRDLMRDPRVGAIFEATVVSAGEQASIDILERQSDGGWDLVEVKSASRIKPEHLQDLSMQKGVFEKAGIFPKRVRVLMPNREYVLERGGIDAKQYFVDIDVTEEVTALAQETLSSLNSQRKMLEAREAPDVAVGDHCNKPRTCPFFEHCHQNVTETRYPVRTLYGARKGILSRLAEQKIADIRHIPDEFEGLSDKMKKQREVTRSGVPIHNATGIETELKKLVFPIHFMDFETIIPGIPLYPGTKAYDTIPFQFSVHTLQANGRIYHTEYLHSLDTDPRKPFSKHLLKALRGEGTIMVYSFYEERILKTLSREMPESAEKLGKVIGRIFDLLPVVRDNTYYPEYQGKFSIKKVLPVFVDDLSYEGLMIPNGNDASIAFMEMIHHDTTAERRMEIGLGLKKYCQTDTEALLKLVFKIAPGLIDRMIKANKRKATPVQDTGTLVDETTVPGTGTQEPGLPSVGNRKGTRRSRAH